MSARMIAKVLALVLGAAMFLTLMAWVAVQAARYQEQTNGLRAPRAVTVSQPFIPDWIMIGSEYGQLVQAGYPGPPPQYLLCEPGGTGPDNAARTEGTGGCTTEGNAAAFTSEATFAAWAPANHGKTALLDMEATDFGTPAVEGASPLGYICKAALLAAADHVRLIEASTDGGAAGEQEAARCGAPIVELQYQAFDGHPSRYLAKIAGLVKALRKIREHLTIIAGIGTDASGWPVSPATLYDSWRAVRGLVNGYWLNAAHWANVTTPCIPDVPGNTVPTGCVITGLDFMQTAGFQGSAS